MGESFSQILVKLPERINKVIQFIADKKKVSRSMVVKAIILDHLGHLTNDGELLLEVALDQIPLEYKGKEEEK